MFYNAYFDRCHTLCMHLPQLTSSVYVYILYDQLYIYIIGYCVAANPIYYILILIIADHIGYP